MPVTVPLVPPVRPLEAALSILLSVVTWRARLLVRGQREKAELGSRTPGSFHHGDRPRAWGWLFRAPREDRLGSNGSGSGLHCLSERRSHRTALGEVGSRQPPARRLRMIIDVGLLIAEPDNYSEHALRMYRGLGPVWLGSKPPGIKDPVEILVVRLRDRLDAAALTAYPELRAIVSPTTGLTHIDLGYCAANKIRVYSLNDCRDAIAEITSTPELALGLIIALVRQIPRANDDVVRKNIWSRDRYESRQLSALTLGIVGFGRIGQHLARYALAIGMRVLACDPYRDEVDFGGAGVQRRGLDDLAAMADVVSINANLRADNDHLISAELIRRMPGGALIVNTARGQLLDEDAAARAVRAGHLGGVAVDVLCDEHTERDPRDSPLAGLAREGYNVIITPHIGGATSDAMRLTEDRLADFVVRDLGANGKPAGQARS